MMASVYLAGCSPRAFSLCETLARGLKMWLLLSFILFRSLDHVFSFASGDFAL